MALDTDTWLVLGEVVTIHIHHDLIRDGLYDTAAAAPIMRGGGAADYFRLDPIPNSRCGGRRPSQALPDDQVQRRMVRRCLSPLSHGLVGAPSASAAAGRTSLQAPHIRMRPGGCSSMCILTARSPRRVAALTAAGFAVTPR